MTTTTYKVLGQSNPTANTATTLYTVPSATSAVASTLSICNTGAANATVSVAVVPGGGSVTTQNYVVNGTNLVGNDTIFLTVGFALATTDIVSVTANTGNVSFSLFGSQIV